MAYDMLCVEFFWLFVKGWGNWNFVNRKMAIIKASKRSVYLTSVWRLYKLYILLYVSDQLVNALLFKQGRNIIYSFRDLRNGFFDVTVDGS